MQRRVKNSFFLLTLIIGLGLLLAGRVTAQTFTVLHYFTNTDGAYPYAGLILSGNKLYGATTNGGSGGVGVVFSMNINGTGFTVLHNFSVRTNSTNSDGACPAGTLTLSGSTLYGTTYAGGIAGNGTIFAVNVDGTGFTNLHGFSKGVYYPSYGVYVNSDGANPQAGLILSSNTLYGTALNGGSQDSGTVFKINTDGSSFTTIYTFGPYLSEINSNGIAPYAGLVLSGNALFGAAGAGGSGGDGTVFAINTDGTGMTNLHNFISTDGNLPQGGFALSGGTLYGVAYSGGSTENGTIFKVNTNGTGVGVLHNFTGTNDGSNPTAELFLSGNTLYGTASKGGSAGYGSVFAINTNGTSFTNLHNFVFGSDGAYPASGLILSGNTLYGTALRGGSSGYGTVFSISLPLPQLKEIISGTNVILKWPTNAAGFSYAGFTLQSTTNLGSTNWSAVSPAPVVAGGQYTVTNAISGTGKFYRLKQ